MFILDKLINDNNYFNDIFIVYLKVISSYKWVTKSKKHKNETKN